MSMLEPLSELEAVNAMLLSIGQAPVNTLNIAGLTDVSVARDKLREVTRRVLSRGYAFNTDDGVKLSPDADGVVVVPRGALKVKPSGVTKAPLRAHPAKGRALWNSETLSWTFAAPVECRITWGFPFEELPETARCYIATAAGREFQARIVGSTILDRFLEEDVQRAWFMLEREERSTRKTNLFRDNAALAQSAGASRSY